MDSLNINKRNTKCIICGLQWVIHVTVKHPVPGSINTSCEYQISCCPLAQWRQTLEPPELPLKHKSHQFTHSHSLCDVISSASNNGSPPRSNWSLDTNARKIKSSYLQTNWNQNLRFKTLHKSSYYSYGVLAYQPCNFVDRHQHFRAICYLHLKGRRLCLCQEVEDRRFLRNVCNLPYTVGYSNLEEFRRL
jgi:hypothetical protein